jgi:hypothetical protein
VLAALAIGAMFVLPTAAPAAGPPPCEPVPTTKARPTPTPKEGETPRPTATPNGGPTPTATPDDGSTPTPTPTPTDPGNDPTPPTPPPTPTSGPGPYPTAPPFPQSCEPTTRHYDDRGERFVICCIKSNGTNGGHGDMSYYNVWEHVVIVEERCQDGSLRSSVTTSSLRTDPQLLCWSGDESCCPNAPRREYNCGL